MMYVAGALYFITFKQIFERFFKYFRLKINYLIEEMLSRKPIKQYVRKSQKRILLNHHSPRSWVIQYNITGFTL